MDEELLYMSGDHSMTMGGINAADMNSSEDISKKKSSLRLLDETHHKSVTGLHHGVSTFGSNGKWVSIEEYTQIQTMKVLKGQLTAQIEEEKRQTQALRQQVTEQQAKIESYEKISGFQKRAQSALRGRLASTIPTPKQASVSTPAGGGPESILEE